MATTQAQQIASMQRTVNQIVTTLRRTTDQSGKLTFDDDSFTQPGCGCYRLVLIAFSVFLRLFGVGT
jgi:hypothetical protein